MTTGRPPALHASAPLVPAVLLFLACAGDPSSAPSPPPGDDPGDPPGPAPSLSGEVWGRTEVTLRADGVPGNPFEVRVDGTFTHRGTGERLTIPGFHDGEGVWRVSFMPTRPGTWEYRTSSPVAALDGRSGVVEVSSSSRRGPIRPDPAGVRKWAYDDGTPVVPIALRIEFFSEPASRAVFEAAADVLADNEVQLMETRLTEQDGMFDGGRHDFIFAGDWRDHRFDLAVWNRMERRMDALAERGLGAHVMFYSDDAGEPGWRGRSETERLVIRYAVARLAAYPTVFWNTGIDIAEYRSEADIDWFGERLRALDPYAHPRSSRRGGGSGEIAMDARTFESWGPRRAEYDELVARWESASSAVSFDDAWGERYRSRPEKSHSPSDIRRAVWKGLVAGGAGGILRGNGDGLPTDGYFSLHTVASDWESEQWVRLVNPFVRERLGPVYREMRPAPGLAGGSGVHALADPRRERILYLSVGEGDRYDEGGDRVTVRLSGESGRWTAAWFDPRSGRTTSLGSSLEGDRTHTISAPSSDDWVLLLERR